MFNLIYNFLGLSMLIWYGAIRWTMYADKIKYPWAYAPINMLTAFISIAFIIPSLFFMYDTANKWMVCIAIFLLFRNIYYTIEDIIDYSSNPQVQTLYIILDILMGTYAGLYIIAYKNVLGL